MSVKKLKLFLILIFLASIYFSLISYPYFLSKITNFSSLGFFSAVEERELELNLIPSKKRTTDRFDNHILANEKVVGNFKSTENNLGIVLVRFSRFGKVSDRIIFRIKEKGKDNWYYENTYNADQFQDNQYFTFGFPSIADSKNKSYIFELESVSGKYNNGIGVSLDKPQSALVYKYTRSDLASHDAMRSFAIKKLVYVAENINLFQAKKILVIFVLTLLLIAFLFERKNIKSLGATAFTLLYKKVRRKTLERIIFGINTSYSRQVKKAVKISKKINLWFTSTELYLRLLNTIIKKRIAVSLLIFFFAFTYRFTATLVDQINLFYTGIGGQSDYDQFIRAATCAVKNFCLPVIHQNFLIESTILGFFYEIFGFTGGLKVYLYLMLILSSMIATIPYLLLSRKNWLTIGGIIGGIFLASSDFLTRVAISFPPDNLSLFTFSLFYVVYFAALRVGTVRWLILLGLAGLLDGLTKALFLINAPVALALFVPIFFYKKIKSAKNLLLAFLPLFIFLILYGVWEYIVQVQFNTPYFLRSLIESGGSFFVSYTSFKESASGGNIFWQLYYYSSSLVVTLKRILEYAGLTTIFLAPIFFGLLFFTFKKQTFTLIKFFSFLLFSLAFIILLALIKNNFLGIHELGEYIFAWPESTYVAIFLLTSTIFLFVLNIKYSALRLFIPILPYFIMLIILTKNSPFARLWVHVVVWGVILLAYILDYLINSNLYSKRVKILIGSLLLIIFILFYSSPKLGIMALQLQSGLAAKDKTVTYLKWVEKNLPPNTVILGGIGSDLVVLSENLNRPIIFNTMWAPAILIKPGEIPGIKPADFHLLTLLKRNEIPGITPSNFSMVRELQDKKNFKKNKYIILENDVAIWRSRLTGVADAVFTNDKNTIDALHSDNYSIKVYKYNPTLKKAIYELNIRNH
jgi:hypothetical protein